jgi:hypothetical protein
MIYIIIKTTEQIVLEPNKKLPVALWQLMRQDDEIKMILHCTVAQKQIQHNHKNFKFCKAPDVMIANTHFAWQYLLTEVPEHKNHVKT